MRATFKLLNSYFWKTYYGPILIFIFPTLLLSILGNVMRIEYVFPGILAMVTLFIGIQVMPLGIMELKGSTLYKYIGSTPVNPKRFASAVVLYYILLNLLAVLLVIVLGSAIFYKDVYMHGGMKGINYGLYSGLVTLKGCFSFIFANLLHIIMTLAIGLAIATFSKTPQQALTLGLIIVIPSMFLSGMVITVDVIARSSVMQWLSRLVIFRYTTGNIVISSTPTYQLGSILQHVNTKEQLGLIFNIKAVYIDHDVAYINISNIPVDKDHIHNFNGKLGNYVTISDFKKLYDKGFITSTYYDTFFNGGDDTLFKQIFTDEAMRVSSDNGIFQFNKEWGVRRVPDVQVVKEFITTYFKGKDGNGGNTKRFANIYDLYISKGKFGWLDMFMNQNILLYTKAERILNVVVPILTSIGASVFAVKKFSWSAR